jgi:gliding motility-associated protein GldM
VKKKSAELCKMVDDLKSELYLHVEGLPSKVVADTFKLTDAQSKDNFDIPTHWMLGADPEKPGADAHIIPVKEAIIKFRKDVLDIVPAKEKANLKLGLKTDDVKDNEGKTVSWEFYNFDHTTMAATMCLLAGIKNDIKNAESDVCSVLLKAITAADFSFDVVEAKVVAPKSYITLGEEYTADVFMAAYSSTQSPEILVGNVDTSTSTPKIIGTSTPIPVLNGLGKYTTKPTSEGLQNWSGIINVKAPDGSIKPYAFSGSYMAAKPSFAVSATKMNVFYIGVANPVSISASGAAPSNVVATLSGEGRIDNKGQGNYEVTVNSGLECTINVAIKDPKAGGAAKSAGPGQKFRIRKVPNPNSKFAGVIGDGSVTKGELLSSAGVVADLSDFVFDLKFPITSWSVSMLINGTWQDRTMKGPAVSPEARAMMGKATKGSKILIEGVFCQKPGERGPTHINGINLKIK